MQERVRSCGVGIRVFALLSLAYWLFLKFARAPASGRGDMLHMAVWGLLYAVRRMAMAVASSARLRRTTDTVPWSLYKCGPWSSRPQPLECGGDTTPCEDTRGDRGLPFNFDHQVLLQSVDVLPVSLRKVPQIPTLTSVVTGPGSRNAALHKMDLCSACDATAKRWTQYWRTVGTLWLDEGV